MQELRGQHCSASRAGTLAKVGVQIELTRLGQPLIQKKKKTICSFRGAILLVFF